MDANPASRFRAIMDEEGVKGAVGATMRFLLPSGVFDLRDAAKLRILRAREGSTTVIQEINGSKMELDLHPESPNQIERELALYGTREPASTRRFTALLHDLEQEHDGPIHVFDVGSNVGYFALLEARILQDKGRIYAVEADPTNVARMDRNVELNGYENVETLALAAGATEATMDLVIEDATNHHKMGELVDDASQKETIQVDMRPLDSLVEERGIPEDEPIVVRIDTEGYENKVFEGMQKLMASKRPVQIFLELHPSVQSVDIPAILDHLKREGFTLDHASLDGGRTMEDPPSFDALEAVDRNAHLFAHRA